MDATSLSAPNSEATHMSSRASMFFLRDKGKAPLSSAPLWFPPRADTCATAAPHPSLYTARMERDARRRPSSEMASVSGFVLHRQENGSAGAPRCARRRSPEPEREPCGVSVVLSGLSRIADVGLQALCERVEPSRRGHVLRHVEGEQRVHDLRMEAGEEVGGQGQGTTICKAGGTSVIGARRIQNAAGCGRAPKGSGASCSNGWTP